MTVTMRNLARFKNFLAKKAAGVVESEVSSIRY